MENSGASRLGYTLYHLFGWYPQYPIRPFWTTSNLHIGGIFSGYTDPEPKRFPQRVEEGAFFNKDDPNASTEMFSGMH